MAPLLPRCRVALPFKTMLRTRVLLWIQPSLASSDLIRQILYFPQILGSVQDGLCLLCYLPFPSQTTADRNLTSPLYPEFGGPCFHVPIIDGGLVTGLYRPKALLCQPTGPDPYKVKSLL